MNISLKSPVVEKVSSSMCEHWFPIRPRQELAQQRMYLLSPDFFEFLWLFCVELTSVCWIKAYRQLGFITVIITFDYTIMKYFICTFMDQWYSLFIMYSVLLNKGLYNSEKMGPTLLATKSFINVLSPNYNVNGQIKYHMYSRYLCNYIFWGFCEWPNVNSYFI